uniref:Iron permease FTR1 n=1 Tax=Thermorudis peleae TaxID=1382356 RepID=A0A831X1Z8_9BACT
MTIAGLAPGRQRGVPRRLLALFAVAVLLVLLGGVAPLAARAAEPQVDVQRELAAIRALMRQSQDAYRAGDVETALRLARQAYLDHFELVEIPLRVIDPNFTLEMEYRFAEWRNQIEAGAPAAEVDVTVQELERGLDEVEALFEGPGLVAPTLVTVASFSILFREGIEVILVLAAILGYIQTQNPRLRRPLWWGAGLAIPASILTWFVLNWVLRVAPIGREVIEALVSLLAVALMFYISFWLLRRLDVRRWMEFLRAKVWDAVAVGNTGAVAALGFVSVYREGAETALFYQALLLIAQRLELWVLLGIGLAILALSVIGWAIIALGARLPLRAFLGIAVAVIMLLSVGLLGNAVWELQQIGVIPMTLLGDSFPRFNRFLADLLGLHATLETVVAQSVLLLVYLAAWLYAFWWQPGGAGTWRRQGTGAG